MKESEESLQLQFKPERVSRSKASNHRALRVHEKKGFVKRRKVLVRKWKERNHDSARRLRPSTGPSHDKEHFGLRLLIPSPRAPQRRPSLVCRITIGPLPSRSGTSLLDTPCLSRSQKMSRSAAEKDLSLGKHRDGVAVKLRLPLNSLRFLPSSPD